MTKRLLNNRYQITQVLGAGGFGETFLAEDTHMPSRRRCVIKQLKPMVNDPQNYQQIQQRFEKEAAILEYLGEGSNQIPRLYAYFSEHGEFYLVQELIDGQNLTEVVESRGSLNEKEVRQILLSLLSVLDYVHSKGIIHRDIKPDNIILRQGTPILIDFGAVKETIVTAANVSKYPTRSLVIGTPGYMPSEQAVGRPVYATDIYSLGLTAIYLLTGKPPQDLHTNLQTGEILWEEDVQFISPALANILNKAIQPNAGDRYSTASKMLYALQSATTNSPLRNTTAQTVPVSPPVTRKYSPVAPASSGWQKPSLIFGGLVTLGLLGAIAIANTIREPQAETAISPVRESEPVETPTPEELETPVTETAPESVVTQRRSPSVSPIESPPVVSSAPQPEIFQPTPSPPIIQSPVIQPPIIRTPQPQQPIIPVPSPQAVTPTPQPEPTNNNNFSDSIPAFPTGTPESTVKAQLGEATKVSRGYWNTRAYLYRLQPNRVDLGLLFDRESGILRQTEASFAQSVNPQIMQSTLQGMLNGNFNGDIQQGLQQVYQRQNRKYSFQVGQLEGVIERNREDRIYIAVWDEDLH